MPGDQKKFSNQVNFRYMILTCTQVRWDVYGFFSAQRSGNVVENAINTLEWKRNKQDLYGQLPYRSSEYCYYKNMNIIHSRAIATLHGSYGFFFGRSTDREY